MWSGAASRPTKGIDFLGRIDNSLEAVTVAMKNVCEMDAEADDMNDDHRTSSHDPLAASVLSRTRSR